MGCVARLRNGLLLAAPLKVDALAEDCASADIVISAMPVIVPCTGPRLVIDRRQMEASDGTTVTLSSPFELETVTAMRGDRPWNPKSPDLSNAGSARPAGPGP